MDNLETSIRKNLARLRKYRVLVNRSPQAFSGKDINKRLNETNGELNNLLDQLDQIDLKKLELDKAKTKLEDIQKAHKAADQKEKTITLEIHDLSQNNATSNKSQPGKPAGGEPVSGKLL